MKDFSTLAQYWGQDESSVHTGPMAWADWTIDIKSSCLWKTGKMGFKYYVLPLGRREGVR